MPEKILIIDDETALTTGLAALLQSRQYQTASENSAVKGLDTARQFNPDVIIIDWQMPKMNGIEFIRNLKSDLNFQGCYIIMLSGNIGTDNIVEALDAGADDYLIKPFEGDELLARVRSGLRIRSLEKRMSEETKRLTVLEMALSVVDKIGNPIAAAKMYAERLKSDPAIQAKDELQQSISDLYSLLEEALLLMNKYQQLSSPRSIPAPAGKTMIDPE